MMYPVLAKVRYDRLDTVTGDRKLLLQLASAQLGAWPRLDVCTRLADYCPDLPEYRTGLIIVGLARCIAMVIIWNDLACGDREAAAVLVALNSVFQVIMFAVLGWFYLSVLPGWLGLEQTTISTSAWQIAKSVLIFLGIPLLAGLPIASIGRERPRAASGTNQSSYRRLAPGRFMVLLFTIIILFALQGDQITSRPFDVARIALPLLAHFAVMWGGGYVLGALLGLGYQRTTTLAFTAAGNNFELAIAVAIATYGATSGQALAGVVGPLIEVPVLVALVYVFAGLAEAGSRIHVDAIPIDHRTDRIMKKNADNMPAVLFCAPTTQAARKMALGYFNHLAGGQGVAWSGGRDPATRSTLQPSPPWKRLASTSPALSQALDRGVVHAADVVVTIGCGAPARSPESATGLELAHPQANPSTPFDPFVMTSRRVRRLLDDLGITPRK